MRDLFKKYYHFITSFFVFLVYLTTIAPTVVASDAGELAAVQYTLGIAHPTGYPLFTIIGYLYLFIPLPFTPIFQLNLLAAIWTSLAVGVFILTVKFLLDNISEFQFSHSIIQSGEEENSEKQNLTDVMKYLISISSGLFLAFSKTFWIQSTSIEVYSLHMFLFSLSFYYLLKGYCKKDESPKLSKDWILFAAFLALGFANHLTMIFILPAAAFLFFNKYKTRGFKKIFLMLLIFIPIVVVLYAYLPLRALSNPVMNWGNPVTLNAFSDHVTGQLYHQYVFLTGKTFFEQISLFFRAITINFDWTNLQANEFGLIILLSFVGIFKAYFSARKFFYTAILILIFCVLITASYGIPDIEPYYLSAYYSLILFAVFGLLAISQLMMKPKLRFVLLGVIVGICLSTEIYFNYYRVDESDNYIFEDYTKSLMNSVDANAIVMSNLSSFYFPTHYYQFAENYRKDIVVVEHLLLQQRWYYAQIKKSHPEVIRMDSTSVNLDTENRSIYVSYEIANLIQQGKFNLEEGTKIIPDLFLFKIVKSDEYSPATKPDFKIRYPEKITLPALEIKNIVISMLLNRAIYELQFSKLNEAKSYLKKLNEDFPEFNIPTDLKALIES